METAISSEITWRFGLWRTVAFERFFELGQRVLFGQRGLMKAKTQMQLEEIG